MISKIPSSPRGFWLLAACLVVLMSALFYRSFLPGTVVFKNDGSFGILNSQQARLPEGFRGAWEDLNWVGGEGISASPDLSNLLGLVLRPEGFSKFYAPLACLLLGLCAWKMFRELGLAPAACALGGLAAALNSCFFSTACWGVAAQTICFGANSLAVAALADLSGRRAWLRVVLAGFAVGWGVMEGFDIGAIFSLVVAAFAIFQSWNAEDRPGLAKAAGLGLARVAVVAVFAAFISAQTIGALVGTQIKGVAGAAQDAATRQKQWAFATQWSLPKTETLQILVPGLFGWRMYDNDHHLTANSYWGRIGENPGVADLQKMLASPDPRERASAGTALGDYTIWRFTGSGLYAGVPVVVLAVWTALQGFRRRGPFSLLQRRAIRFWLVVAVISLLLAFGKYAPFYRLFYSLPYTSTIRNPTKFMHVVSWALVILFGYGVDGIVRAYLRVPSPATPGGTPGEPAGGDACATPPPLAAGEPVPSESKAHFNHYWFIGSCCAVVLGLAGWVVYAASSSKLQAAMQSVGVPADFAPLMTRTSVHAVGWFELSLVLTVILLAVVFGGGFAGTRAAWGAGLLGVLLVADLAHADLPWITFWDVPVKYASNPIVDLLRDQPWEHRVAIAPVNGPDSESQMFQQLYQYEWRQHVFPYYNIQTLDVFQESRETTENKAFRERISAQNMATLARLWQLTNTRYLLGTAELPGTDSRTGAMTTISTADLFNQDLDPVRRSFHTRQRFSLASKNGKPTTSCTLTTAVPDPLGPIAVIEFTGALPRAGLYSNWLVQTNGQKTLALLADPDFDPVQTVIVGDGIPVPSTASTNPPAGTVRIKPGYQPKRLELAADAQTPCVLLLNDHYSPGWRVTVDGKPGQLLRCNYLMQGVALLPGHHEIIFRFVKSMTAFYVSLFAVVLALSLCGWLALDKHGRST